MTAIPRHPRSHARRHRRGAALIVAMWVSVALAGLVLVLANAVRTEAGAIANRTALAQLDAAERGAEQYVLALVAEEVEDPGASDYYSMEQRQIGECLVWIIRPDYDDDSYIDFGLVDEASRLDLNTATRDMLINLPGMSEDLADIILDWRDEDSSVREQGAEDDYYLGLPEPYRAKNGPFESVDELHLLKDFTPELVYGYDRNRNRTIDFRESEAGGLTALVNQSARGIYPFVTAWGLQAASSRPQGNASGGGGGGTGGSGTSRVDVNAPNSNALRDMLAETLGDSRAEEIVSRAAGERPFQNVFDFRFRSGLSQDEFTQIFSRLSATPQAQGQQAAPPTVALINIHRAPREVLLCLPNIDESDVSAIIARREGNADDPSNIAWLAEALSQEKAVAVGGLVTGTSQCFSAEIVVVSRDGRAFKRSLIVVDARQDVPRIMYRKDLTSSGWPLDEEIRELLRSGQWQPEFSTLRGATAF